MNRRQFLNRSAAGAAMAGLAGIHLPAALTTAESSPTNGPSPDAVTAPTRNFRAADDRPGTAIRRVTPSHDLPCGTLGNLKLSRLISGGNIVSGWCHARDLLFVRSLAQAYLTRQKQFDTLQLMEEQGINAIVLDMIQMDIVNEYRKERGGQMQTLTAIRPDWSKWGDQSWDVLRPEIERTMEQGAQALFVHGGYADRLVQWGKPEGLDLIAQALEFIRAQRFPAGLGAHALEVPMACLKKGIEPDFYFKTFHHDQYWSATPKDRRKRFCVDGPASLDHNEFHDNIFCVDPEDTIAFMRDRKVPWIAFKVLAGGAIHPRSGFQYAFENGADFVAAGMFDWEVVEDVKLVKELLPVVKRERPWRA